MCSIVTGITASGIHGHTILHICKGSAPMQDFLRPVAKILNDASLILTVISSHEIASIPGEPEESSHFKKIIAPWVYHRFE